MSVARNNKFMSAKFIPAIITQGESLWETGNIYKNKRECKKQGHVFPLLLISYV